jgi:hypothetical protein
MAQRIIETVDKAGWASMRPVKDGGGAIGDFQLGYGLWLVLVAGCLAMLRSSDRRAAALLAAVVFFTALSVPAPLLNAWLWRSLPGAFSSLTNDWPMQRSYLVVAACTVFLFALSWPAIGRWAVSRRSRVVLALAACAALCWSAFQASSFVRRGYGTRMTAAESSRIQRPGNANLTQTAYTYLELPRNFTFGTRDPESEMRLIGLDDGRELLSNARAGNTHVVAKGRLTRTVRASSQPVELSPKLILEPGKRYRLIFDFTAPRMNAILSLNGETTRRSYLLPRSGAPNGFGMDLGNSNAIPLWTDSKVPESVTVSLAFPGNPDLGWSEFAGYTLEEVDRPSLPLRVERLVPDLAGEVDAPKSCWLETPRMALPGYEGRVDGAPAALGRSGDGTILISVPSGRHHFELRYPGPAVLKAAFAAAAMGWSVVLLGTLCAVFAPQKADESARRVALWLNSAPGKAAFWASCFLVLGLFALCLLLPRPSLPAPLTTQAYVATQAHSAFERAAGGGPLSLAIRLPVSPTTAVEPLLTTGAGPGSSTVFVRYRDAAHISIGLDQWGADATESQPIPIKAGGIQTMKIMVPGLAVVGSAAPSDWSLIHVSVWLNGLEVFRRTVPALKPGESDICVLRNGSGSSVASGFFTGDILSEKWLPASEIGYPPIAPGAATDGSGPIRIRFYLPAKSIRQCEPLLSLGRPGDGACVFLNYVDSGHVQIGIQGPGTYFFQSPPLVADYAKPQEVTLSSVRFYPEGGAGSELFSKASMGHLRTRTILAFNGEAILMRDDTKDLAIDDPAISIGENTVGATYANSHFTGDFEAIDRAPPASWPATPGSDRPDPGRTVGPLEITVLLPSNSVGRNEPLLVTGRTGEGTILIIRYVDSTHVMIGADVWGQGLYWGPAMEVDYGREISFTIWTSALFPERASLAASIPPATLAALRKRILVKMDGKTALDVASTAYDSKPEQVTVGRSDIGGSNQGPEFTGIVLVAKRLDPLTP